MTEGPKFHHLSDRSNQRILDDEDEALRGKVERDRGRPLHIPSPTTKGAVTMLRAFHIPNYKIAEALGISESSLNRHYRHELDTAEVQVDLQVLTSWMKNVKAGKEMTILSYMQNKYFRHGIYDPTPALPQDASALTEDRVKAIAHKINEEFC